MSKTCHNQVHSVASSKRLTKNKQNFVFPIILSSPHHCPSHHQLRNLYICYIRTNTHKHQTKPFWIKSCRSYVIAICFLSCFMLFMLMSFLHKVALHARVTLSSFFGMFVSIYTHFIQRHMITKFNNIYWRTHTWWEFESLSDLYERMTKKLLHLQHRHMWHKNKSSKWGEKQHIVSVIA